MTAWEEMYQVFVIKPIFEIPFCHSGYFKKHNMQGGKFLSKENAQAFSTGQALSLSSFHSSPKHLCVRVNAIEIRMFKAPDYNEYPAVFT